MPKKYTHKQAQPDGGSDQDLRSQVITIMAELLSNYNSPVVLNGVFFLKDLPANPPNGRQGQIASVNGKLVIFVTGTGWVKVGTQT